MKKSIKAGTLLGAGLFAVSGCAGADGAGASGAGESTPAAAASPTPTLAVGQNQYTADELEAALIAVNDQGGTPGQVINDANLRPQLEGIESTFQSITSTPESCCDLAAANISETISRSNAAILQFSATDSMMVISYDDALLIDQQVENNAQQMADCSEFQMEAGGQVITASAEGLDASTDAETTQGYSVTTDASGQKAVTLQISAFSGSTNITVNLTNPADAEAAVAEAEETINAVLVELA